MATRISKQIALTAIEGREKIHCFVGMGSMLLGADWDNLAVMNEIGADSAEIYIAEHPVRHNLCVVSKGNGGEERVRYFDVSKEELEKLL